jgi:tubulin--tyrosine ligase
MADRGMGIRLFNNKEALQQIFENFENAESDDSDDHHHGGTAVVTSQLRHFVIQVDLQLFFRALASLCTPHLGIYQ